MHNAKIETLYRNKGDHSDCNSYRSIPLLSIMGNVFARVLVACLQVPAARIYSKSQCGAGPASPPLTWCSLYDNCSRNSVNRTSPYIPRLHRFDGGV